MLAHLARNGCQHYVVAVIESNFKESVGLLIYDSALRRNQIVFRQMKLSFALALIRCCQIRSLSRFRSSRTSESDADNSSNSLVL